MDMSHSANGRQPCFQLGNREFNSPMRHQIKPSVAAYKSLCYHLVMKAKEHKIALEMRREGKSINEIAKTLSISKGTASIWCKPIQLSQEQRDNLLSSGQQKMLDKRKSETIIRRRLDRTQAETEFLKFKNNPLFLVGLSLYAGEGSKGELGAVQVANCEPWILKKSIQFFELIGTPKEKITVNLGLHDQVDDQMAKIWWSEQLGIPLEQFRKSTYVVGKASKRLKGNVQPNGTCYIRFSNVRYMTKILKWLELLAKEQFECSDSIHGETLG